MRDLKKVLEETHGGCLAARCAEMYSRSVAYMKRMMSMWMMVIKVGDCPGFIDPQIQVPDYRIHAMG
jgi:hypothetical protein